MTLFKHKSFRVVCVLFAFFVISGDLIADAVHDAEGACVTESQSGNHDSCPACGCSVHTGTALSLDSNTVVGIPTFEATLVLSAISQDAAGPPAAIDHPPQLA